jgi:hypothetical protein
MPGVARAFPLPLGNGKINLDFDKSVWPLDGHFTRDMDDIVEAALELDAGKSFTVGAGADVVFTAKASGGHHIELVWPEREDERQRLATFGVILDGTEVGVRVMLEGTASASVAAKVPVGAIKVGFGAEAGASLRYERFKTYTPASTSIGAILGDAVGTMRLPAHVRDTATLPAPKEILTSKHSGYLTLSADASWGATLTNSRGISAGDLELDFEAKLTLAATAAAKYRIAGEFDLHCCRAGNRARFIVFKSRESQFSFAADFRIDAEFKTEGLPKTANEFLGKLLGADVDRVLRAIDKVQKLDSLEDAKKAVGDLAAGGIHKLAQPLIQKALSEATVKEFLKELKQVTGVYTSLDARIASLLRESLKEAEPVLTALDKIIAFEHADALKQVVDPKVWSIFRMLAGERLYDALLDATEFDKVIEVAKAARTFINDAPEKLKAAVATLQHELALDGMIRKLQDLSDPDALANLADEQLRKLVSLLLDEAFDKVAAHAEDAFARLKKALRAVETFNEAWYKKLLEAANSSYSLSLNVAFSRASSTEALVDVELDLDTEDGRTLAARAAVGDFAPVLAKWQSASVRIRDAVLTRQVTRESQVHLNVLGFELSSLSRLISRAEAALRPMPSAGMVLVYTTEAELHQEKRKGDERTASSFIVRAIGETQNPSEQATKNYLLSTLRNLSASYEVKKTDEQTSVEELLEYLEFAETLGLLTDRAAFVAALQRELPSGWTGASVEYVIRYDETALPAVFQRKTEDITASAARSMRNLIGAVLIGQGQNLAITGLAYGSDVVRAEFERNPAGFENLHFSVTVPAWITKDKAKTLPVLRAQMPSLARMLRVEKQYLKVLGDLDKAVDTLREGKVVAGQRLTDIATDFVALADDMPQDARINPFFGILDALVAESTPRGRKSVLLLELTPKDGGDKVTKVLTP